VFVRVKLDFINVLFHNIVFRRRGQSVVHFNDNDMQYPTIGSSRTNPGSRSLYSTGILRAARRWVREGDRKEERSQRSQNPNTGKTVFSQRTHEMLFGCFGIMERQRPERYRKMYPPQSNWPTTEVEAPLTLKRISRVLLALIVWATPFACIAQADKSIKIHAVFKGYYERIRPGYGSGMTTEEETITLSHGNQVQETWTSSNENGTKEWNSTKRLGEDVWRVVSPHKFSKTEHHLESVRVTTIEFYGTRCKASWVEKLLPGFHEYRFYSISIQQDADYRQARMVSSTCEIISD
jgi:hypothetical protein